MLERNFISSGEPNTWCAERPDTTLTQDRMLQVGPRLIQAADRVALRHRAAPKAGELREDEPHPMAALVARPQLLQGLIVAALLRLDEAREIKGLVHRRITKKEPA
jgi:hypothetical protein